jgi:putative iron-only hydrogenase system regulator
VYFLFWRCAVAAEKLTEVENRIAVISIIIEGQKNAGRINELLSGNGEYIIGRMGIPHRQRDVSIICIVLDAPADVVSSLSGKIGMIDGVTSKTVMGKKSYENQISF